MDINVGNVLAKSVLDAIDEATKTSLESALWAYEQANHDFTHTCLNLDHYWSYYQEECVKALHEGGAHVTTRTHQDIYDAVKLIRDGQDRESVKQQLRSKLTTLHANEEEMLDNAVDLAASVLLMINFCTNTYGFSGRLWLKWTTGIPLESFLHDFFTQASTESSKSNIRLEKTFTAQNLSRIAGLEIVWTDNILDHLRLTDDDRRVHIFHHASFLEVQRRSKGSLLPRGFADETLRTLALLIPSSDAASRKWFARLPNHANLDKHAARYPRLKTDDRQVERFAFWRDRLVMLKQVFDEARPNSLSQWWFDRRNGVQWYTFWVAILVLGLTIFFGLVQSIEGALQVYASFKALKLSSSSTI